MIVSRLKSLAIAGGAVLASGFAASAQAALVVDASVGGAPAGLTYVNFNNLAIGSAGGSSGGLTVSFTGDGLVTTGTTPGIQAAPFISNSNGVPFGDATVSGPDTTRYLSTGIGSVTIALPGDRLYLGLLWGSVDSYNTLSFYEGASLVGSLTGLDVTAGANGNQGASGTYYVNVTSDEVFNRIVATSTSYAFEIDNVSYNPNPVPEPVSPGLFGLGMLGIGFVRRRKLAL